MITIPEYHVTESLYESVHSLIYRAYRQSDNLPVVLKVLRGEYPSPEETARFKREYEITHSLTIDGVIRVYGLEHYKNTLVMVLEDFGGESLAKLLPEQSLNVSEFLHLAIRITDILGRIHQQHIMHKDINPSNIVWNPESGQLKIIDFGISTTLSREQPEIRNPEVLEGTLAYISPEQTGRMNLAMDYRTDLYSLGATCYHLLTGQLPFSAKDAMEVVHCHLAKMPVPPCGIIETHDDASLRIISAIILKLMAKNAEDRYQSALGLKADLQSCLDQLNMTDSIEAFDIGQHDVSDRFQIPQKLYGREQEIDTLLTAFDRVATPQSSIINHQSSILLVAGYAGIGKSSLVNEIQKPIVEKRSYFISGKFDQFTRNIPYSALIHAFQGLVRQLLSESEERITVWKEQLLGALGPNGQVLIKVIPDLELMLGKQPAVPDLPPAQAQNRFNFVFQNFVRTCATVEHPLVLFLDDLQWTDWSSLQVLELLSTDPRTQYLLMIGAYRDNEVTDTHPLMLKLNDIRQAGATVNTITLKPLDEEYVNQLIADTLHTHPQICTPLAELACQKTGGNPFFLIQFLRSLYEDGLLECDLNTGMWKWDLNEIRKADMTDNVVDLMVRKIQKLPEETQHVLKLAACIGNQFVLQTLSIVHEHSPADTMHDLREALQEELIIPLDDTYKYVGMTDDVTASRITHHASRFTFLHDRVQQAAYSLIKEKHRQEVHLKIGQLLLSRFPETEREERIFEIVNHLNIGKERLLDQPEKDELAELNLLAGQKAKASAAYQAAFTYLQVGIDLLEAESWQRQYDLTLALYVEAAEAAYLSGEFGEMERLTSIVLQQAKTLLDKVKIYEVKIVACLAQNKLPDAVKTGLSVLKLLGLTLPKKPNKLHLLRALLETKFVLAGRRIEDLSNLPEMTDPYKLAIIRIAMKGLVAANMTVPDLFILCIYKLAKLLSRHGHTPLSGGIYAGYGMILCGVMGDIESGYRFGKLALRLLQGPNAGEYEAQTIFATNTFIRHYKEHVKETLSPLLEAYQRGLEAGDLEFATLSVAVYAMYSYFIGKNLPNLEQEMASFSEMMDQLKQETFHNFHNIQWQIVLNLIGKADASSPPWRLVGEAYDEERLLPLHVQANDRGALGVFYCNTLLLCYLFQMYPQALQNTVLAETYLLDAGVGILLVPLFHFYDSLTRLAVYPDAPKTEQRQIRKKVAVNQKKMKKWARHAPMNYLHKWYLVEAERARVLGKDLKAMDYYDKAIAGARENEYLNEEALANEVAARFYLSRGKERIAQVYMREARYCYLKWGAKAKVRHLDQHYPELLRDGLHFESGVHQTSLSLTDTSTAETSSGMLDLAAVMEASHILSGEIVLEQLLKKLIRIAVENAGAEKGILLFQEEAEWVVKAETGVEEFSTSSQSAFPASIITYVARTREFVVLEDARREGQFMQDEYVLAYHPKSVLCIPLLNQGKLIGILYLENNLTPGAFTPKRVEVVKLLSSQAASSLENATLYNMLEQKVAERTAELTEAKKAADDANQAKSDFLSKVNHEVRTPLNTILGYTQRFMHNRKVMDEYHDSVETIYRSGEQVVTMIDDLLDLSKIEARQIDLKPEKVDLPKFLRHIGEMIRIQAQQKNIVFNHEIAPDLPAVIQTDEQRLRQILLNLLNNAVKFTDKGSVTLRVRRIENCRLNIENWRGEESNLQSSIFNLQFSIEDTGIGIPPNQLERIFLPFYQVENPVTATKGTGLGLTISQQLAHMLGSELHVKSAVGHGTTFWFDLEYPLIDEDAMSASAEFYPERSEDASGSRPPQADVLSPVFPSQEILLELLAGANGRYITDIRTSLTRLKASDQKFIPFATRIERMAENFQFEHIIEFIEPPLKGEPAITPKHSEQSTILLVDDTPENLNMLIAFLEEFDFRIAVVQSGEDALKHVTYALPDLVLLDVLMPGMNGFETCRCLKEREDSKDIPVIFMTALSDTIDKVQGFEAGGIDYITKPFQQEEVLARIYAHLDTHRLQRQLQEEKGRFQALSEATFEGILIHDEGQILEVNRTLETMFGYQRAEVLGKHILEFVAPRFHQIVMEHIRAKDETPYEAEGVRKDESIFPIEVQARIMPYEGRTVRVVSVRDLSWRKTMEAEKAHLQQENITLRSTIKDRYKFGEIIGKSPVMQEVYERIAQASASNAGVLICGESGTGKELIARTIHQMSDRKEQAFVAVNCGAVPEPLFEREFFGHRKGAFTDATMDKAGYFDRVHKGTLFLDEVSELTPAMQVKLLRVLQDGEYIPLGDTRTRQADVRIITATNKDLKELLQQGAIRDDFFYRIRVIVIDLPPLRERKEDIPLLIEHFLVQYADGKDRPVLPGKIIQRLCAYQWPGNVRELQNELQRYLAQQSLEFDDMFNAQMAIEDEIMSTAFDQGKSSLQHAMEEFEKRFIAEVCERSHGNRKDAAEILGIDRKTLYRKLKKYGAI